MRRIRIMHHYFLKLFLALYSYILMCFETLAPLDPIRSKYVHLKVGVFSANALHRLEELQSAT